MFGPDQDGHMEVEEEDRYSEDEGIGKVPTKCVLQSVKVNSYLLPRQEESYANL
jgi:hypothetical protein